MLVERLYEALVETTFFYCWGCTGDTLLTLEVGVVAVAAGGVAGGLAIGALGLSKSERC
jgi:hypothetical protein